MAKKEQEALAEAVRARREQLRERRYSEQKRQFRFIISGILGLLILIGLAAIVLEFIIVPRQAVAEVAGEKVSLGDWQERVAFQRAQLITSIDEQFNLFFDPEAEDVQESQNTALRFVRQASGQQIALLTSPLGAETLGEFTLNQMVDDALIRQEAAARGIVVTEEDIDAVIGESFNYYGGGLPTPEPTGTATPVPTPSVTPIGFVEPTAVAEEEAAAEALPSPTPFPTPTAVSEESYQESLQEDLDALSAQGVNTDLYREAARSRLYRERLAEDLFREQELPTEAEHAAIQLISFTDEAEANATLERIQNGDFLQVWNEIRSAPPPEGDEAAAPTSNASELLWRTEEEFNQTFSPEVTDVIFSLPVGSTSELLKDIGMDGSTTYLILKVTGREVRPLSELAILRAQGEALNTWLEERRKAEDVQIYDNWRSRIPRQPVLPLIYRQNPDAQTADPAAGQNN